MYGDLDYRLLPLAFMPEGSGDFIRSLPLAVIFTILGSLIVALTIVPFLSSRILKPAEGDHSNIFLRGLQKVIHGTYARLLDVALRHPVLSLLIALSMFVGSLFLIPVVGTSLFPASENHSLPSISLHPSVRHLQHRFYHKTNRSRIGENA